MDKFTQDYCKSVRRKISNRIIGMRHSDLMRGGNKDDKKITYHQLKGLLGLGQLLTKNIQII